jgi:hypothetical protein
MKTRRSELFGREFKRTNPPKGYQASSLMRTIATAGSNMLAATTTAWLLLMKAVKVLLLVVERP